MTRYVLSIIGSVSIFINREKNKCPICNSSKSVDNNYHGTKYIVRVLSGTSRYICNYYAVTWKLKNWKQEPPVKYKIVKERRRKNKPQNK